MITNYFKDLFLAKLDTDIEQIALATNYDNISSSTNITSVNQKYITATTNKITSLGLKSSITIDKLTSNIATTFISGSITSNSFDVISASGFNLGDKILVKNNYYKISNISGNTITILGNFVLNPSINDSVQQIITQLHLVNNSNTTLFVDKIDLIKNNNIVSLNTLINTSNIKAQIEIQNDVNFIPNPNAPTNLSYNLSGNNLIITWDNMNVQYYEYELINITTGITSNNTVTFDITDPFYNIDTNLTYTFKVRSLNRTKVSSYSTISIQFNTLNDFIDYDWTMWNGRLSMEGIGSSITSQEGNNYLSSLINSPTWTSDVKFEYGITFTTASNNNLRRLEGNYLSSYGTNFKLAYACVVKFNTIANNRHFILNHSYRNTSGIVNGQFFSYISTNSSGNIKISIQIVNPGVNMLQLYYQTSIPLNTVDYFGFGFVVDLQNSEIRFIINNFSTNSYGIETPSALFHTSIANFKANGGVASINNWNQTGIDPIVTSSYTDYTLFREVLKKDFSETAEQVKDIILNSFSNMGIT